MHDNDTIAAIATPNGTGAVAIIRISGIDSFKITNSIFNPNNTNRIIDKMAGYSAVLGMVYHKEEAIDQAVVFIYRAPLSYTGEDVVEISCHGGSFVAEQVLGAVIAAGARPAMPGEFTKRAFLNGKLNLSQAEGICDLINAQGEGARKAALAAKGGLLSTEISQIVETLAGQLAHLSAWADYPEEDMEEVDTNSIQKVLEKCTEKTQKLLDTYPYSKIIRQGISTVILGKPNAGKSTLMNLLSAQKRSIVTDVPGTTRDIIRESIRLSNFTLNLSDTAGIRNTTDAIELEGIAMAIEESHGAQLILAVFDGSEKLDNDDKKLLELLADKLVIAVINKADLPQKIEIEQIKLALKNVVTLSAKTAEGQQGLQEAISKLLGLATIDTAAPILANKRQLYCVEKAQTAILEGIEAIDSGFTLDAVSICLDEGLEALLSLTGERATEKVVDEVFARFCVGK